MLIIAICSVSCKKKKCALPSQTPGSGEIIPHASIQDTSIRSWKTNFDHVIQADSQNVLNLKVSFDGGVTFSPPDFSQYTILGKYAKGTCRAIFERNVSRDNSKKECVYKIKVRECGSCELLISSMNWVLVPKIPDDYNAIFVTEKTTE